MADSTDAPTPAAEGARPERDRPWVMRTYAGHSSAAASNELYRRNLAKGQTGLSVAFDLPTQTGYDPDHVLSRGEVGKVGVPISHIGDMRRLFDQIPLGEMNTSMTINAVAMYMLALYQVAAEEQAEAAGQDPAEVRARHVMDAPYVVKPNNEGSSVGVYIVHEGDPAPALSDAMPARVMVEAYAPGRELTTTVLGDRALGVTEIVTAGWYDYDAKYSEGGSRHVVPAEIPDEVTRAFERTGGILTTTLAENAGQVARTLAQTGSEVIEALNRQGGEVRQTFELSARGLEEAFLARGSELTAQFSSTGGEITARFAETGDALRAHFAETGAALTHDISVRGDALRSEGRDRLRHQPRGVLDAVGARGGEVGERLLAEAVGGHPRPLLVGGGDRLDEHLAGPAGSEVADSAVDPVADELDPAVTRSGLTIDLGDEFFRIHLGCTRRPAFMARRPADCRVKGVVRAGPVALGAVEEARRPTGMRHRLEQEGIQRHGRIRGLQLLQGRGDGFVEVGVMGGVGKSKPLCRFQYRAGCRVALIVLDEARAKVIHRIRLGNGG